MLCRILANISPNSINRFVLIMYTEIHCEVETENLYVLLTYGQSNTRPAELQEVAHSRFDGLKFTHIMIITIA